MAAKKHRHDTRIQCPLCPTGKEFIPRAMHFHFEREHPGQNWKNLPTLGPQDIPPPQANGHSPKEEFPDAPPGTELGGADNVNPPPRPPAATGANGSSNAGEPKKPPAQKIGLEDAALLVVTPRRFEANATFVWQAQAVTEREWGWKHTDNIGDWLDTYLWWSMKKFGIILGGYVVLNHPEKQEDAEVLEEVG